MTTEEFAQKQAAISDKELIELADHEICKLAKTGSITMSVPPEVTDTDMLFSELIKRFENTGSPMEYNIDFAGYFKCTVSVKDNKITIDAAINGWGDAIDLGEITITEFNQQEEKK
jgi:hypothetical protein